MGRLSIREPKYYEYCCPPRSYFCSVTFWTPNIVIKCCKYGKAVRVLIYPLITFLNLYRYSLWLAGGSLTAVVTYCRVASIHLSAMAKFHFFKVLDLDCPLPFHLCVIGLIVSPSAVLQAMSLRLPSRFVVYLTFLRLFG